jgi:(S)-ureidoglycine aminohydrolase
MILVFLFWAVLSYGQTPAIDTLTGGVAVWDQLAVHQKGGISRRQVITGATRDLALLDVRAFTLAPGQEAPVGELKEDQLIIVKDGNLSVSVIKDEKLLGPGGVALFASGEFFILRNKGGSAVTYYALSFRSRSTKDPDRVMRAGGSHFFLDWPDMVMKQTNKGESRQIFSRPVAWLGKIDMHATTLNPGEVSHPPHVHRAEEIILMRSGNAREYIGGKYYKATAGDLIFLPSGVQHALENQGAGRCEYFALQWEL